MKSWKVYLKTKTNKKLNVSIWYICTSFNCTISLNSSVEKRGQLYVPVQCLNKGLLICLGNVCFRNFNQSENSAVEAHFNDKSVTYIRITVNLSTI